MSSTGGVLRLNAIGSRQASIFGGCSAQGFGALYCRKTNSAPMAAKTVALIAFCIAAFFLRATF